METDPIAWDHWWNPGSGKLGTPWNPILSLEEGPVPAPTVGLSASPGETDTCSHPTKTVLKWGSSPVEVEWFSVEEWTLDSKTHGYSPPWANPLPPLPRFPTR